MKTRRKVYFPEGNEAASVKDLETEKQSRLTWEGLHNNIENGKGAGSLQQVIFEDDSKNPKATDLGAVALGYSTKTGRASQLVAGEYNIGKDDTLFEIGYGDENGRSNAFEVTTGGIAHAYGSIVAGKYNEEKEDTLLELGNGTSDKPENVFEVTKGGVARAYGVPEGDNDVVRMFELNTKVTVSKIDADFFNSLY